MADINPSPKEVAGKVPELREAFKTKLADNIKSGVYDQRDVDRLATDDAYARCFLRTLKSRGDIQQALDVVDPCFRFRKEMGINDLKESSFPEELTSRNGIYYKGTDKNGHPILYINPKENTATKEQMPLLKKYIAYHFEMHHSKKCEQMCIVLLDMSQAGVSNMNLDITKFIITCFTTYFPTYLAYMINYDMGMILSGAWSVISAFLNQDQKKKLLMVKKKNIGDYINEEHLWSHMK